MRFAILGRKNWTNLSTTSVRRSRLWSSIKKNVIAIKTGTININRTVFRALRPAVVRAANDNAPKRPDPPVPDDQVDTTFLDNIQWKVRWIHNLYDLVSWVCTHLSYLEEYCRNVTSPKPPLIAANTTPKNACHCAVLKDTIIKLALLKAITIRTLSLWNKMKIWRNKYFQII